MTQTPHRLIELRIHNSTDFVPSTKGAKYPRETRADGPSTASVPLLTSDSTRQLDSRCGGGVGRKHLMLYSCVQRPPPRTELIDTAFRPTCCRLHLFYDTTITPVVRRCAERNVSFRQLLPIGKRGRSI